MAWASHSASSPQPPAPAMMSLAVSGMDAFPIHAIQHGKRARARTGLDKFGEAPERVHHPGYQPSVECRARNRRAERHASRIAQMRHGGSDIGSFIALMVQRCAAIERFPQAAVLAQRR